MNQYTNDELQLLAETYDLTVDELKELLSQGYSEEDLQNMYSPETEQAEQANQTNEEEPTAEETPEEPEVPQARMGISLKDAIFDALGKYSSNKYDVGGQANNVQCPPGQVYDPATGNCVTSAASSQNTSLDDIGMTISQDNPEDLSAQEIENDLGPSGAGSISQQNLLTQQRTAEAAQAAVAPNIEATDPYKGKDMQAFTDIGDKTRQDLRFERAEKKVINGVKQGAKYLFGSEQGQGMMMGLGNMATDALTANAMNKQVAGLKQARVFNINPDFFNGANPNVASSTNYDMASAIYAEEGASVQNVSLNSKGTVPIEAEGGEMYFDPNSMATIPISGPKHEQGGVPFDAEPGAFVFSDSQKVSGKMVNEMIGDNKLKDKKEYTIAEVIKKFPSFFDTKKDAEELTNTSNDSIRNSSIKHNLNKKMNNLSMLLAYQQNKNGKHGEENTQDVPMARNGLAVYDGGGETTDTLPKDSKGRFIVNGKAIGKEDFAKVKATPQEQALHARQLLEAAQSGKKYYVPSSGPYAGLPFDISKEKIEGPASKKGQGINEVFTPYSDVATATKAASDFTTNPTNTRQYTTPGAPGYFAGGINPKLVEDKFGGRDNLLKQLKLDPSKYQSDIWNDPSFEKDFFNSFEHTYVPKDKWRPVHGDDHFFGLDYYDFIKEPEKSTSTFTEVGKKEEGKKEEGTKTIPTPPQEVPGKLYEDKLTPYDYGRFFSDVATMVPEEYLQQVSPRYKPLNLITAREEINQAARIAASANLSGSGNQSIDAARQAAMYSDVLDKSGRATENAQNINRSIIDDYFQYNNAQFLNAQNANEAAKADFTQRTMQNQQAAQETRRQAQEDFAEKSRNVAQFNAGLRTMENLYSPQYSTFVGPDGNPVVKRDGTAYAFSPQTQMFGPLPALATSQVKTANEKEQKQKQGGKVKAKSKSRKLIK